MAFKSLVLALSILKVQGGREFDPASKLVSYVDRGSCGPRGDDAKAELSQCGTEWIVMKRVPSRGSEVAATIAGCDYFAYTVYQCKLPVDPSSSLVTYWDRDSCGPKGDDAKADLSQCGPHWVIDHKSVRADDSSVVATKDGCDYFEYIVYKCEFPDRCQGTKKVVGGWASLGKVVGIQTRNEEFGTERTNTNSQSRDYTNEVTVGIESSTEVSFLSPTVEASGSVTVSAGYRHEWSQSYTQELSTTKSEKNTFEITVGSDHQGKNLWQFQFTGIDSCDRDATVTFTKAYSFTDSIAEYPCCFPGHCNDADKASCNWCTPGYKVDLNDVRCKEGYEPCASGAIAQLPDKLGGYVALDKEVPHGSKHAMSCPHRFEGTVVLSCNKGDLSVEGHSCIAATKESPTTIPLSNAFMAYLQAPVLMIVAVAHHINFG